MPRECTVSHAPTWIHRYLILDLASLKLADPIIRITDLFLGWLTSLVWTEIMSDIRDRDAYFESLGWHHPMIRVADLSLFWLISVRASRDAVSHQKLIRVLRFSRFR